jgi:exodeoxyribonuclease-1
MVFPFKLESANARTSGPLKLIQNEPVFLLSEHYGAPFNYIITAIAKNANNPNEWALFDLRLDPAGYLDANDEDLRAAIDSPAKAIRRVSINAQPGLLPVDFSSDDVQGGPQSLETYRARARVIRDHPAFRQRISRLLADRYKDRAESAYVEERIYSGFVSDDGQTRMHAFHEQGWEDRIGIIQEIEDDRYRQIGQRIVATERPELLTAEQRLRWNSWSRDRLRTNEDVPWLTVSSALAELAGLSNDTRPNQQNKLAELKRFFEGLGR